MASGTIESSCEMQGFLRDSRNAVARLKIVVSRFESAAFSFPRVRSGGVKAREAPLLGARRANNRARANRMASRRFCHAERFTCQNSSGMSQLRTNSGPATCMTSQRKTCKWARFRRKSAWIAPRRSGVRVPLAPLREPLLRRGFSRFGALSGLGDFGYAGGDNGPDVPKLPVSARISGTKPAGGIRRSGRSTKAPG
jgi:hypothetical protein